MNTLHPTLTTSVSCNRPLRMWLALCLCMVFLMVIVGGLTRLTESGLSIVEWKPVTGTLPPLSAQAWEQEFFKYQASPQYQTVNRGMSLAQFKNIFWLEYLHRLLGRVIGLIFFAPLLFFWVKNQLPMSLKPRLVMIFLLGAAQGGLGWYMVKSGLVDMPAVSPYRLSAHLLLAFALFALLLWSYLDLARHRWQEPHSENTQLFARLFSIAILLLTVQVGIGGLVAGLDAGLIYNSFPDMNGRVFPHEIFFLKPLWRNFFENAATVQFTHRVTAFIVAFSLLITALYVQKIALSPQLRRGMSWLILILAMQFTLGVLTLLSNVALPLASLHQAFALILFGQCVMIRHGFNRIEDGGFTAAPS